MAHFICQLSCLLATIFQTDSLHVATQEVTPDTLLVLDIDRVLIQPSEPAFQTPNIKKHSFGHLIAGLSESERIKLIHALFTSGASTVVEADAPCLVRRLTDRGAQLVAITNTIAKESYEDDKTEKLRKLGFVFCPLCEEEVVFTDLPRIHGSYPTYRCGILFTNDISKGMVLRSFLNEMEEPPKRVVFVDDQKANLDEVEMVLSGSDIEFFGYLYTGADAYPSEEITQEEFEVAWQRAIESLD